MADRGRRAFPISSALIHEHQISHAFKIHRQRVTHMKAAVDTAAPEDFTHFQYNAKRAMIQAERLFEIERDNRILLEKMERYTADTGSARLRPWTSRTSLNYKNGMVLINGALVLDHMNIPANVGTSAGGTSKTSYKKRKELEHLAHENMKILKAIEKCKPMYSAQTMEHEYLENVSRIDRLATFRGPRSAAHRTPDVGRSLEVAKSMRSTKWRPGTEGYQRDLAKSMGRSMKMRQGCIDLSRSPSAGVGERLRAQRPSTRHATAPSAAAAAPEYQREAVRSVSRAATMTRSATLARGRQRSVAASASDEALVGAMQDRQFEGMFAGDKSGQEDSSGLALAPEDLSVLPDAFPERPEGGASAIASRSGSEQAA